MGGTLMEAKEVVSIIQSYRHDLLNDLQIIQGYVKLGKMEKVDDNLNKLFAFFHKERKLLNLNIPHVVIWFLEFRMKYNQFKLDYSIRVDDIKLTDTDLYIKEKLDQIIQDIEQRADDENVYTIHVDFTENEKGCTINVSIDLKERSAEDNIPPSEDIYIKQTPEKRIYSFDVFAS